VFTAFSLALSVSMAVWLGIIILLGLLTGKRPSAIDSYSTF
jgi:hypothetical protein